MRVADYIMQRISQAGAKHLFMVTGRGVLYLSDAAAKCEDITCVSVHHEQGGAYAAMAYAQYNQKLGACLVSTGCAMTNAITPVLCAWQDEIPMIVISGQNMLNETVNYTGLPIRTYGQQEANIIEIVKPITKYAQMVKNPEDIGYIMDKALFEAHNGRKGPIWIDVPLDIQNARVEESELKHFAGKNLNPAISEKDLDDICEKLDNSKRPVVVFGSSIRSSDSIELFKNFVEKNNYPVVYTGSAVDLYGTENRLSMGVLSAMAGNRAANFAVQNSDFILVLGNRLTAMATGNDPQKFAREAEIYTVDLDENEHKKGNINIDKNIIADVKDVLEKLNKKPLKETSKEWQEKCLEWKKVFPKCEDFYKNEQEVDLYQLADALSNKMSDDDVLVTDAGLEELIIPTNTTFKKSQRALHPVNQGAMGYAIPGAIGGYLASGKNTIVVVGDGSIMMNIQELQTIAHNKLPIKIIVVNNNCYAVIRKRQVDLFRTRTVGTDKDNGISCPDFEKVANCFGFKFVKINSNSEIDKLDDILKSNEPVICEIMGKPDQKYLHSSYRKNKDGKFVQPPLEDQSPFMDRELFLKQMVIEPIDL